MVSCQSAEVNTDEAKNIVIDGHFEDWQDIAVRSTDPIDPSATLCDFRDIKAAVDENSIYFYLGMQHESLLTRLGGSYKILIDTDDDPTTGWLEAGMQGVDMMLDVRPVEAAGEIISDRVFIFMSPKKPDLASKESEVREIKAGRIGLLSAPTHRSTELEIRIRRGVEIKPLPKPLFAEGALRAKFVAYLRDGRLLDETDIFRLELQTFEPWKGAGDSSAIDPLRRDPDCRLRVVTWNVSHRTIRQLTQQANTVLESLDPDLILLNEISETMSLEEVEAMISGLPWGDGHTGWNLVYGQGGGEERCVIASRYPLRPVDDLLDLDYPLGLLGSLPRDFRDPKTVEDMTATIADKISTAGAIVEVGPFHILATSLSMQSKGFRTYGWEEFVRQVQAATIRSTVELVMARETPQGLIVAGDFNLVVTRVPLDMLRGARDFYPGDLAVATALQLDGRSNFTWSNPGSFFLPGRLDYLLYDDTTLQHLQSFAFDSADLSAGWLEHHGLTAQSVNEVSDHLPIVADFGW